MKKRGKKRTVKKKFNLVKEYKQIWKYLKECRTHIYIAIGIFLAFFLIAFFIPAPQKLYDQIIVYIREILSQTENMSSVQLIQFIISNNLRSTFFNLLFGFAFGIYPALSAVANGYVLGFVSSISVENGGILTLWKLFPHGIFELPAIFISLGTGLKLSTFILKKDKLNSFRNYLINSIRVFLFVIVPLLIIAGIIEGTLMALLG